MLLLGNWIGLPCDRSCHVTNNISFNHNPDNDQNYNIDEYESYGNDASKHFNKYVDNTLKQQCLNISESIVNIAVVFSFDIYNSFIIDIIIIVF